MRRFRVGIISNEPAPTTGGAHGFVKSILSILLEQGNEEDFDLFFLTELNDKEKLGNQKVSNQFGFQRNSIFENVFLKIDLFLPRISRKLKKYLNIERKIENLQLDFVFFLGSSPFPLSVPYGVIVWDLQHRTHPWFPEVSTNGLWESRDSLCRSVLPRASIIVTGTEQGKGEISLFYGVDPRNIVLIPHPVPQIGSTESTQKAESAKENFTLVYPAQFWAHKNHIYLIEAIAKFKSLSKKDIKVILLGSDKGNKQYIERAIADLNLEATFIFPGFVTEAELVQIYQTATALVYPSFSGPENLPPLEALSLGLPVLYSNFPGAREQLGEFALYFDPFDVDSLVTLLNKISVDPNLLDIPRDDLNVFLRSKSAELFVFKLKQAIRKFLVVRNTWI